MASTRPGGASDDPFNRQIVWPGPNNPDFVAYDVIPTNCNGFNYEVINNGNTPLTGIQVNDNVLGAITERVADGNGDDRPEQVPDQQGWPGQLGVGSVADGLVSGTLLAHGFSSKL